MKLKNVKKEALFPSVVVIKKYLVINFFCKFKNCFRTLELKDECSVLRGYIEFLTVSSLMRMPSSTLKKASR